MTKEGRKLSWFKKLPEGKPRDIERLKILAAEGQHFSSIETILFKYQSNDDLRTMQYEDVRSIYIDLRLSGGKGHDIARKLLYSLSHLKDARKGLERQFWAAYSALDSPTSHDKWVVDILELAVKRLEKTL